MIKAFSFLIIGFMALLFIPLCIGLAGGLFGLVFGLIGGAIGLVAGLFGAVIGVIAWIFKGIFHLLFGWHWGLGFHPFHWSGFWIIALIIIIFAVSVRGKK
jgi:hypothetical protein